MFSRCRSLVGHLARSRCCTWRTALGPNLRGHGMPYEAIEDTFTFQIQTWLPDFMVEIRPVRIFCASPIWAEIISFLGNNTIIHSLSIDRQLNTRITALPKLGIHTKLEKIGKNHNVQRHLFMSSAIQLGHKLLKQNKSYSTCHCFVT